jgi:hypothetical protein
MILEEAIGILSKSIAALKHPNSNIHAQATRLGIEALERLKEYRQADCVFANELLPSEGEANEVERLREEAIFRCCSEINGVPSTCEKKLCSECGFRIPGVEQAVDAILSLEGIAVLDDDQSLPSVRNAVNKSYNDYMLGQEDMLDAGFRKVVKHE